VVALSIEHPRRLDDHGFRRRLDLLGYGWQATEQEHKNCRNQCTHRMSFSFQALWQGARQ